MTAEPGDIYFHTYGQGPVKMVGLHGWSGSHRTYAKVGALLPSDVGLLAMDLPGYKRSPDPPSWALNDIAAQIAAQLRRELPGRFTLVGNCSGCLLTLKVAPMLTDRIDRLILVEPFAYLPWYFGIFLTPVFGRLFYWSAFGNGLGRWLTDRNLKNQRTKDSNLAATFKRTRMRTTLNYLRRYADMGEAADFADIGCPVSLIYADKTFASVKESVQIWHEVWPSSEVVELHGAGHLMLQEIPQDATTALLSQLGR